MNRKILGMAAFGLIASIGTANATLIDNFDNPAVPPGPAQTTCVGNTFNVLCPGVSTSSSSFTGAGIIGGTRDVTTTLSSAPTGGFSNTFVSSDGNFTHQQTSGSAANTAITWNAGGAGLGGGAGVALSGDAFHIVVIEADLGIEWKLEITDAASNDNFIKFSTAAQINSPTDLFKSFSLFPDIDFSHVLGIRFTANDDNKRDVDTTIGLIETNVPEPGSLAILGSALLGFGLARRRRRNS
jgi:hypothetical protein